MIAHIDADILLLTGFDYDAGGAALGAFANLIEGKGVAYPHHFALRPNAGLQSGADLDGDGRIAEPEDAQGYGEFAGQGGMAILSRFPIDAKAAIDFSGFLWADLPGAIFPPTKGADLQKVQRLSTIGHWDVPVQLPDGSSLRLLAFHATPPVFDGPEDRNGRRNHDEAAFWLHYLDGAFSASRSRSPFFLLGDANLDPADGDGRPEAWARILAHPAVLDPLPSSPGGRIAASREAGANDRHRGDPALDTANWRDDGSGPGNLRVDYVLPSRHWQIVDAGVFWPAPDDALRPMIGEDGNLASRHRMVWVDVRLTRPDALP